MSTNIAFEGFREVIVVKTGLMEIQTCNYGVWQTPTEESLKIMRSDDPIQAYKDWVNKQENFVYNEDVYAEDDIWCEREPIGIRPFDTQKEHLAELDRWVERMNRGGWSIRSILI